MERVIWPIAESIMTDTVI